MLLACLWNFVLGYLESCFVAMGVLLQWCCFVIFEEDFVQRIYRHGWCTWRVFMNILVRFEICKGIRKHISYLLVWNFMSFVGCHGNESCCHENCCYGECRHKVCRHDKCRHRKCRHEKIVLCLLLGIKKISKGWNENLILILHGVGVVRICTNVKFRMFFFCLLFVFL